MRRSTQHKYLFASTVMAMAVAVEFTMGLGAASAQSAETQADKTPPGQDEPGQMPLVQPSAKPEVPRLRGAQTKGLVLKGKRCYRKRDYPCALKSFEAAFALEPTPELRFNLASAQDKLGLAVLAFRQYRLYLKEVGATAPPRALLHIQRRLVLLRKQVAQVEIVTEPQGCGLRINGSAVVASELRSGKGRLTVLLEAGAQRLEFSHRGYHSVVQTLMLRAGDKRTLRIALSPLPAPTRGSVTIMSRPSGARILLNGTLLPSRTPTVLARLLPGRYRLQLGTSHKSYRTEVVIAAGQQAKVNAELQIHYAPLRVESRPRGSAVHLDGRLVGRTPMVVKALAAGKHRLELRHWGYKTLRQDITIAGWHAPRGKAGGDLVALPPSSQPPVILPIPMNPGPLHAALPRNDAAVYFNYVNADSAAWALGIDAKWRIFPWLILGTNIPLVEHGVLNRNGAVEEVTGFGNMMLQIELGHWPRASRWGKSIRVDVQLPTSEHYDDIEVKGSAAVALRLPRFVVAASAGAFYRSFVADDWVALAFELYGAMKILPWLSAQTAIQGMGFFEPVMAHPALSWMLGAQLRFKRNWVFGLGFRLPLTALGKLAYSRGGDVSILLSGGYQR